MGCIHLTLISGTTAPPMSKDPDYWIREWPRIHITMWSKSPIRLLEQLLKRLNYQTYYTKLQLYQNNKIFPFRTRISAGEERVCKLSLNTSRCYSILCFFINQIRPSTVLPFGINTCMHLSGYLTSNGIVWGAEKCTTLTTSDSLHFRSLIISEAISTSIMCFTTSGSQNFKLTEVVRVECLSLIGQWL